MLKCPTSMTEHWKSNWYIEIEKKFRQWRRKLSSTITSKSMTIQTKWWSPSDSNSWWNYCHYHQNLMFMRWKSVHCNVWIWMIRIWLKSVTNIKIASPICVAFMIKLSFIHWNISIKMFVIAVIHLIISGML